MSRNQKAPLLAFVLVALVCCMVLVDSMRGDASDGQESASSSSSASSAPAGEADPTDSSSADDFPPSTDAPLELSPPFGEGSTGRGGPGTGSVMAGDSVLGTAPAEPTPGALGELEPGAGGAAGAGEEPDTATPPYSGGTEEAEEEGESSPRKAKRRDKGKDLSEHLPEHLPGIGPGSGPADPEQSDNGQPGAGQSGNVDPGNGQPGNNEPGSGQPADGQPGAGSPSVGPSPAVTQVPDLGNLLTLPDLTPRAGTGQSDEQ